MKLATINKELAKLGHSAELVKGGGYFYFIGDDIAEGQIDSVYVYKLNELSLSQWLEEASEAINKSKQIRGQA